jgi:hypothetical protein
MLSEAIEQRLLLDAGHNDGKITKKQIIETCLVVLKSFDTSAYIKYLANHNLALNMRSIKRQL